MSQHTKMIAPQRQELKFRIFMTSEFATRFVERPFLKKGAA